MPAKTVTKPKKESKKEPKKIGIKLSAEKVVDDMVNSQVKIPLPLMTSDEVVESGDSETVKTSDEKNGKKEKYFQAVGRRKESIAIVRLFTKKSTDNIEGDHALVIVNDKDYRQYFSDKMLQSIVESPLRKLKSANRFKATVKVNGGGLSGQADAIKHGLSRTLVMFDQNFRKKLKKSGFLTRDSRIKERRKYGLKKARKAPQWQKR